LGWFFFGEATPESTDVEQHIAESHQTQDGDIVYTCSMHPNVREKEPGNCPICGMELVPAGSNESTENKHPQAVELTETAMKIAEVQTIKVSRKPAVKMIQMPGKISIDERNISIIPAHFPGRIEQLYLNFTGAYVEKGDKLASVYSPELVTAQRELLEAYKHRNSNPKLYQASRQKFINWQIPENVIKEILNTGEPRSSFDIYSNYSGYVTKRHVAVGDHIHFGKPIFEIADLSTVWVEFDSYESDLQGLAIGDQIKFEVAAYPGQTFTSEVTYVDPLIQKKERTISVRTEMDNDEEKLKPNMLAKGSISSAVNDGTPMLQIPREAILWTGERSLVYVKTPGSKHLFEPREVTLGARVGENYIIKEGLSVGEEIVIKGNFMIDSAAQLAGKPSMMNQSPESKKNRPHSQHDHSSMQMSMDKSDNDKHQHSQHLSSLSFSYLKLKNALTNDHFAKAQKHLEDFKTEVLQSDAMNDHPEHSAMHDRHHRSMAEAVQNAANAKSLEQLRNAFILISDNLIKAIQNQNFKDQELFIQYCPMADDGKGAKWLSTSRKIKNPYFGQQMLSCGEIVEQ